MASNYLLLRQNTRFSNFYNSIFCFVFVLFIFVIKHIFNIANCKHFVNNPCSASVVVFTTVYEITEVIPYLIFYIFFTTPCV